MKIPERKECIHEPVCKYDNGMCPCECGYYEKLYGDYAVLVEVRAYFEKLRFDRNHHLGFGDIRLTIGQQEEILQKIREHFS